MDWRTENAKDMKLLNMAGLAPLDPTAVAIDGNLVEMVQLHNARLACALDRLRRLVDDRERLVDFDVWCQADSANITTARCHVRRDSWDAILELRRVLEERQTILGEMARCLGLRCSSLDEQYRAAVAAAEKRLRKERQRLERANFATADGHFADLVAGEKPVAEAAEALDSARKTLDSVCIARHAASGQLSAVVARQRAIFARMLAW